MKFSRAGFGILAATLLLHLGIAQDKPNPLEKFVEKILSSRLCSLTENPYDVASFNAEELKKSFKSFHDHSKHCEAAKTAYKLSLGFESTSVPDSLTWAENTLSELLAIKEYASVVEIGIRSLNDLNIPCDDPSAERMRFLILNGVYSAAKEMGPRFDPTWLEWALSMSHDRYLEITHPVQLLAFAKDYPASDHFDLLKSMAQDLTDMYVVRVLGTAQTDERTSPFAAFLDLNTALEFRELMVHSPRYPELLSKVVEYQAELAKFLMVNFLKKKPPKWSNDSLILFFGLPTNRLYNQGDLANEIEKKAQALQTYFAKQSALLLQDARSNKDLATQKVWAAWASQSAKALVKYKF